MGNFEFIEHTADKGFRVEADDLQGLFTTSVAGLANMLREDLSSDTSNRSISYIVDIEAQDKTALLIDFLSEVLTLSHIHKTVFTRVNIEKITAHNVRAHIYGERVDYFDEEIKAVTFHQADIRQNEFESLETNIIFDI